MFFLRIRQVTTMKKIDTPHQYNSYNSLQTALNLQPDAEQRSSYLNISKPMLPLNAKRPNPILIPMG